MLTELDGQIDERSPSVEHGSSKMGVCRSLILYKLFMVVIKNNLRDNLLKIVVSNEKSLFEWKNIFIKFAFDISSGLVSCNNVDFFLVFGECMSHATAC